MYGVAVNSTADTGPRTRRLSVELGPSLHVHDGSGFDQPLERAARALDSTTNSSGPVSVDSIGQSRRSSPA